MSKEKAIDIVLESIKLVISISSIFLGGIIAYKSSMGLEGSAVFDVAVSTLGLAVVFGLLNVLVMVNKVYVGSKNVIMELPARAFNILSIVSMIIGIVACYSYISGSKIKSHSGEGMGKIIVDQNRVVAPNNGGSQIFIEKNKDGDIIKVEIVPVSK